jgi:hypothetical protein
VAGTTYEGASLASDSSVGVGSDSTNTSDTTDEGAALRTVRLSACALPATVVAATTVKGSVLTFDRLVGVSSASHCGGGQDR